MLLLLPSGAAGFVPHHRRNTEVLLHAKKRPGKGFGSSKSGKSKGFASVERTYGKEVNTPIKDVIDVEGAMEAFFSANEEWSPLFRSFATSPGVPAMSYLGGSHGQDVEFSESSSPWKKLQAVPTEESEKEVVSQVLDSMQQSLVDIPVNEKVKEDEMDLHFLEEGRRMLTLTRFQVIQGNGGGSVDNYETLFSVCWNELAELRITGEPDTGSLIILPDYDMASLRRFTDMNLLRPLQWLGIEKDFEVASMERGSPAIRLLHKLSDIPTLPPKSERKEKL